MWDSLKPEFFARLPRTPMNGAANGMHTGPATAPPRNDWESCYAKLEDYRSYTDDWDGQGAILGSPAKAIGRELIDSAVALMRLLQNRSVHAPDWTLPGVQGTVGFEWDQPCGGSISIEVLDPETFEVFIRSPENEVEHLVITEAVNA